MTRNKNTAQQEKKTWLVPGIVVLIAALLIGFVLYMNNAGSDDEAAPESGANDAQQGPQAVEQQQDEPPFDLTSVETRDDSDPLAVGPVDAPVGLVVFSDYQCVYCAKWSNDTLPAMMKHMDAGDLRIEWRDANVYGPASERAARAAYAAALQGQYVEYHHALFDGGEIRSEAELSDDSLIALASDIGLDTDKFASDLNAEETSQVVAENAQLGQELGVYSTPSFLLGGQPLMGAQPAEVFEDAFEQALAEADK